MFFSDSENFGSPVVSLWLKDLNRVGYFLALSFALLLRGFPVENECARQTRTKDLPTFRTPLSLYVDVHIHICKHVYIDILVLRVGSLGAGSVGFEGQNQFPQSCSSIFRHRVSSCCSISLIYVF